MEADGMVENDFKKCISTEADGEELNSKDSSLFKPEARFYSKNPDRCCFLRINHKGAFAMYS